MKIAICIITFRRPEGLERLLESLCALTFAGDTPELEVVITDNDPERSARDVISRWQEKEIWPLCDAPEPVPGIVAARNRAMTSVGDDVDLIAFIDDDEIAEPQWLGALVTTMQSEDADVVVGPVLSIYESEPPEWARRSGVFDRLRRRTGSTLNRAFTGNVLFKRRLVTEMGLRFDARLAMAGGSDVHLFRKAHDRGCRIVWCDEAVAHEYVPSRRLTKRYVYQRGWRVGIITSFLELDQRPWPLAWCIIIPLATYRTLKGLAAYVLLGWFGAHHRVRWRRLMHYGAGMFAGLLGIRFEEYRIAREQS